MRENRPSGSEGGGTGKTTGPSYLYQERENGVLGKAPARGGRSAVTEALPDFRFSD